MDRSIWKMATVLASSIGLLGATTAYGATSTEVTNVTRASPAPSLTQSASSIAPTIILAAGQRETNLQKSATFVAVSGIESDRQQRSPR